MKEYILIKPTETSRFNYFPSLSVINTRITRIDFDAESSAVIMLVLFYIVTLRIKCLYRVNTVRFHRKLVQEKHIIIFIVSLGSLQ